jgi:RNA polymerase sigma-70 factor, ECF subfamily
LGFYTDLAVDNRQPYDDLVRDETGIKVCGLIERLPDRYKRIITLAYYQRFTYQQMADTLGIPIGTVKSRLHTALKRLEDSLYFAGVDQNT